MTKDLGARRREVIDDLSAQALELSRVAMFTISQPSSGAAPNGVVGVWNRAAEELYGYSEGEVVGRAADFLCFPSEGTALTGDHQAVAVVERHRRRDGSEVFVELRLAASGGGLLVCARDVSAEERARSGLAASRDELHRLAGRLLDAQEDERRRIARELHDDFKQRLAALGFEIAALAQRSRGTAGDGEDPLSQPLEALCRQVAELGADLRRISHQLHPAVIEHLGLAAALEGHAAEVEARQGLSTRVTVCDAEDPLPPGIALGLYRIAQEALENAARHSAARHAHLTLVRDHPSRRGRVNGDDEIRLAVADDGIGFDPAEARGGLGLASMEERARLLGGRLRVASEPGAGTEIEVVVPLEDGDREADTDGDAPAKASGDGETQRLIGPYRLLEVLGEGATATVYLAREPPPLAREVAIKLYRAPLVGRRETFSFKAERQALARLRHPNVGQIYEARTTEDGDPYIVMEHVPGMPITDYCDRYQLDLKQRIELFIQVCDGVSHVHQKGVLHRDLKPANVLVMEQDGKPAPKIVDFGIAKGLEEPLAAGTVWNRGSAGTPAYVSPEALAGGEADTRSDVYALGVMLYKLLAGVLPAETEAEILGQLAGESLPLPSRRLVALGAETVESAADARQTGAGALGRSLRGDLDWITAKALAPDPATRYGGAAALAADLGRHLRTEPVLAGPPALSYRLARFASRHRAAVVAVALGLLALFAGLATTTWQARRAAREAAAAELARAEAEQVTEFLEGLFKVSGPEEARGETLTAREILDRGAQRLDRELAGQPRLRARMQQEVGRIYGLLGHFDSARPLLEASLAQRRQLFGADHAETAGSLRELGRVTAQGGRPAEAEPLLERALAIQERTLGEDHPEVAETLTILARTLHWQGERQRPLALYRRAHEIVSASLPPEHPRAIEALRGLGSAIQNLGDPEQTRIHYQRALELAEEHLGPDHPEILALLNNLATTYSLESDYPRAKATYERLVERLAKVYGPDHWRTLRSRLSLARITMLLGQGARGQEMAAETFETIERTLGPDHWLTAKGAMRLGHFAFLHGRFDRAEGYYQRARSVAAAKDSAVANLAHILDALADVAFVRSDLDRAEALAASVVERLPADSALHGGTALESRDLLARVALARGDFERAEALYREILRVVDPETPGAPTPRQVVVKRAKAHLGLGKVLSARGDAEGARRGWHLAADLMTPLFPNPYAQAYAAVALLHLGRVDEARPIAIEALGRYRYSELIELCQRYGIQVPPLDGQRGVDVEDHHPGGGANVTNQRGVD